MRLGAGGAPRGHPQGRRGPGAQAQQGPGADSGGGDGTHGWPTAVRVARRPRARAGPGSGTGGARPVGERRGHLGVRRVAVIGLKVAAGVLAAIIVYGVVTFVQVWLAS